MPTPVFETPILETPRLLLRPIKVEDSQWVQPLFSDYEVLKYMHDTVPWPYPADGAAYFYEYKVMPKVRAGEQLVWAIVEKASTTPIGTLSLSPHDDVDSRGFWLGRAWHGKGYMKEAVYVSTNFAFDKLRMPRLLLNNAKVNTASAKLKIMANATLQKEYDYGYVAGRLLRQDWLLTPDQWRTSPLYQAGSTLANR